MADCCSPTFSFVLIRTVHFTTCLLLVAVCAFDRLVLSAVASPASDSIFKKWQKLSTQSTLLLLPLIAISGVAWFIQLCVNMSGLSLREAMQADTVRAVWNETNFGRLWQVRCFIWAAAVIVSLVLLLPLPTLLRKISVWVMFVLAAALISSLAWAGHGQDGGPWHLLADAVHLFIAGLWPMGLAPFLVVLVFIRALPESQRRASIFALTFRFSAMSLISVGLLALTGVINALYMIRSLSDLFGINYGRLLIFKVSLFLVMFSLGAVNLLRLKARLANSGANVAADGAAVALQRNVAAELSLGLIVLILTAILGLLGPGSS